MPIIRPFGLSVHEKHLNRKYFEACRAAGVYSVELSCNSPHYYEKMDWDAVCSMITECGIVIRSVHLPFAQTINIASLTESDRTATVQLYRFVMEKAASHGISLIVLHPSSEPIADADRPIAMRYAMDNLRLLADFAASKDVTIAVENLPRTCLGRNSEEMQMLLSVDDRLRSCFDTNHLLSQSLADYVREIGDRIVTLHVSDYDFINERHLLPGELDIDWVELMDLLDEIHYPGVFHYEVDDSAENRYIRRDSALTPEDYRRNYDSLVQRKKPIIPKGTILYR